MQRQRRQLPFKPPRPRASTGADPSPKTASGKAKKTTKKIPADPLPRDSRTSTASRQSSALRETRSADTSSCSSSASGSDSASRSRSSSISEEPDYILAEITTEKPKDVTLSEPTIPPKLLTRLLHHHFRSEKTKIAKDANEVVAKYVDIFVREALARAAHERAETQGGAGGLGITDGFLEVEDLEKMAPQLVMDF